MPEFYLLFLFLTFLLFTGVKLFSVYINRPKLPTIDLSQVTIVIPFRNEEENLPHFLESMRKQDCLPKDIIFVDDHSNDDSCQIIQSFVDGQLNAKLLNLPTNQMGKKYALNYGILAAQTRFILTLDADVILSKVYMKSFAKLTSFGLSSLPVIMSGKGFLGKLFSTEYSFFNAFNYLISPIWPISASGANLLFDSETLDYQQQLKTHQHLASGDDYFLLKEFRNRNVPINIHNSYQHSVITKSPKSLRTYIDQRVRWLSKSKTQVEWTDAFIGMFLMLYFIGGFIALFAAVINLDWHLLLSVFILRLFVDSLVYLNYAQGLRITKSVLFLPFFQLLYPLIFLIVIVLSFFYQPKWKERKTS